MVDNRSAGFFGIGGAFNFKSGDPSGTAAKTSDEKYGPGSEYGIIGRGEEEEQFHQEPYVDRSAQLRATLNSLAMMNVAAVMNPKKVQKPKPLNFNDLESETEQIMEENSKHGNRRQEEESDGEDVDIDMFEDSIKELEKIVESLEKGDCGLSESLDLFEKGIKYTNECRNALDNAEKKIIMLTKAESEE